MVAARRRTAPHSAPPSESAVSARAVSWHPCRIVSLCGSWPAAATELAGYETRGREPAGWLARSTGLRRRLWPRRPVCAPGVNRGCQLRPPVVVWARTAVAYCGRAVGAAGGMSVAGHRGAPLLGAGLADHWGRVRLGLGFVRACGCFGFITRRACGLGGQEQDGQPGPYGGDGAGDEAAGGEAAQEGVGGGGLPGPSQDRRAQGRDLAGGPVRPAEGLVCDRRDPAGHAGGHGGGEP